jgi:hypothetical protein
MNEPKWEGRKQKIPQATPRPDGFMTIKLVTDRNELVTWGYIPVFDPGPSVVYWGTRVFVYQGHGPYRPLNKDEDGECPVYAEAFAYPLTRSTEIPAA